MKSSTVRKAFIALIIANIIWGAASPIFKLALQNIPPFTLAFARFFLASFLLLPFVWRNKITLPLPRRDTYLLLGNAIMGITLNISFYFIALKLTHAIDAPVIASSAPIMTLIFAVIFLREPFKLKKFLGMVLGTIGILVIIFEPLLEKGFDGSVLGNILLVAATLAAVGGTITGRAIFQKYNPEILTFWTFLIGSVSFLPMAFYEFATIPHLYQLLDWRGFLGIAYGAIFSSTIAYTFSNWGLSKISATDASMFSYVDPVAGVILSFLLLGEPITALFILGSILIFGGIFLAEGRLHWHPLHRLRSTQTQ